jgi:hypothetical protein
MSNWQATLWLFAGLAVILLCDGALVLLNRAVERADAADAAEARQRQLRSRDQRDVGTGCWILPGADARAMPAGGSGSGVEVETLLLRPGNGSLDEQAPTGVGQLPQYRLTPVGAQHRSAWDGDR